MDEELEVKGNMDDDEKERNDENMDDDEKQTMEDFISFDDGNPRQRPEVLVKSTGFHCRERMQDLQDFFKGCCQKCGLCQDDPNESKIVPPPPKRYIYWGPAYDIRNNAYYDEQTTVRGPHLEFEDEDDEQINKGSKFVSNYISTTKYSILTFLPLNLLEQFRKKANLYFLIIAILAFTDLSPKNPVFSVTPLTIVLAISAVKEAYEDYKRYEMDKEINNRQVDVCRPDLEGKNWCFKKIAWEEVQVGDMIRITKDTRAFPADLLLLQSSTNQGLCNIETANLDGETNLKIKQAIGATYSLPTDEDGDEFPFNMKLQFKLESEVLFVFNVYCVFHAILRSNVDIYYICYKAPHENISKWVGALYFNGEKEPTPVGMNQFILRGCTLRNTDWIIGIVVFTGVETKISLNNKETKFKRSNVCNNNLITLFENVSNLRCYDI